MPTGLLAGDFFFTSETRIVWSVSPKWSYIVKRNPAAIQSYLQETKSGSVITKRDCIIQFPKRLVDRDLAEIGSETYVFGIFAIIIGNEYAISTIPSMIRTNPSRIDEREIKGDFYYNFYYEGGDVIIENINLIRKDTLIYNLTEEFFLKGNIPWYIGYEDLGRIYDKAKEFADSNVAQNYATMEAMAACISRAPHDRSVQYRHFIKSKKDIDSNNPTYIGLYGNVFYAAPGTVNKLAGSYFQDAVVSALVQPSTKSSHVETLLRT